MYSWADEVFAEYRQKRWGVVTSPTALPGFTIIGKVKGSSLIV